MARCGRKTAGAQEHLDLHRLTGERDGWRLDDAISASRVRSPAPTPTITSGTSGSAASASTRTAAPCPPSVKRTSAAGSPVPPAPRNAPARSVRGPSGSRAPIPSRAIGSQRIGYREVPRDKPGCGPAERSGFQKIPHPVQAGLFHPPLSPMLREVSTATARGRRTDVEGPPNDAGPGDEYEDQGDRRAAQDGQSQRPGDGDPGTQRE